jgi:hypothetical protein
MLFELPHQGGSHQQTKIIGTWEKNVLYTLLSYQQK